MESIYGIKVEEDEGDVEGKKTHELKDLSEWIV